MAAALSRAVPHHREVVARNTHTALPIRPFPQQEGRQVDTPGLSNLRIGNPRKSHGRRSNMPEQTAPNIQPPKHCASPARARALDVADPAVEGRLRAVGNSVVPTT